MGSPSSAVAPVQPVAAVLPEPVEQCSSAAPVQARAVAVALRRQALRAVALRRQALRAAAPAQVEALPRPQLPVLAQAARSLPAPPARPAPARVRVSLPLRPQPRQAHRGTMRPPLRTGAARVRADRSRRSARAI